MTAKPSYVTHTVDEKDVTVDWFFGPGRASTKIVQLLLILVGWFFAVLPMVITASALVHRNDEGEGWWKYGEGFVMWDVTIATLAILTGVFVVGFLALHLLARAGAKGRDRRATYDEQRLAQRLELAADWYANKLGPEDLRRQQRRIRVEPYSDVETYELRGLFRSFGVES